MKTALDSPDGMLPEALQASFFLCAIPEGANFPAVFGAEKPQISLTVDSILIVTGGDLFGNGCGSGHGIVPWAVHPAVPGLT